MTPLRQIDVAMSLGNSAQIASREVGISEQSIRYELLNGEIVYTLKGAKTVIEAWWQHCSAVRPRLWLGY